MAQLSPLPDRWVPPAVVGPAFLRDGTEVWVRSMQASDRDLVLDLLEREPPGSLGLRYFAATRRTGSGGGGVVPSSANDRLSLLVLGDRADRVAVLGIGEYVRAGSGSPIAEVAFLVAGPYRGRGIASLLLARLARAARAFGILRFEARVRRENPEMLEVFRASGVPFSEQAAGGEVDVLITLSPDAGGRGPAPEGQAAGELWTEREVDGGPRGARRGRRLAASGPST